ncbi:MAG: hypothetical protein DRI98_12840 [Bacteroidetes bacterium]|nr:MAG: hypothetical protein DRI98_12840 [Bacteroidota bacterium]
MTKSYLLSLLICALLVFGAWEIPANSPEFPEITMSSDTAFGSGNFGAWETDGFGAPVYRYTCNQLTESRAVTRVNPDWISPTNHMHQIGNDRLVAVVSNYGYVQVRQDEGSPKFLNDFDPASGMYGGGIGFLTDGEISFSTMFPGNAESYDRYFGTGYYRKEVSGHGYTANQVIFAPFGDDPLVISQVTIRNHNSSPSRIKWIEYWDNHTYQFSNRSFLQSILSSGMGTCPEIRRAFANKFSHDVKELDNSSGIIDHTTFEGFTEEEEKSWARIQYILNTVAKEALGGKIEFPVDEAKLEDEDLPSTFLVSLDDRATGWSTNSETFFGEGGIDSPDGLNANMNTLGNELESGDALMIERTINLEPGEEKTLYFAYGYQEEGTDLDQLLSKYKSGLEDQLSTTVHAWQKNRISFTVEDESWVDRELLWHNYYLRSNLTYDDFFKNKILSQGHVYQYVIGFQGAARDPMQHALPFIYSEPEIVKEIIRYSCKEVMEDGSIPYGIVGSGVIMPAAYLPSDTELWLLWLASEYVLATRDAAFLEEQITTYPIYKEGLPQRSIQEILNVCYGHLVNTTGTGKHGLMRLSNGDWNDGAVMGFVPGDQVEEVRIHGESVLNASFTSYVLDLYGTFLEYMGEEDRAAASKSVAEGQKMAVREQWAGQWFKRQWLNDSLGWIGGDVMWLEPQPWAIIGGASTEEQTKVLVNSMNKYMRDPSPIGAMLHSESIEAMPVPAGTLTNGGVWPSINGTLIWALANVDKSLGWDEWKKNTLAYHAEAYPDIWYGIWSGPDAYNSTLSDLPGHTYVSPENSDKEVLSGINWTDFPVMNMHPHAWPLYDVVKLFGLEFTSDGFQINPSFPKNYNFDSPLISLKKEGNSLGGKYNPVKPGEWKIIVQGMDISEYKSLTINGVAAVLNVNGKGELIIQGSSTMDSPLKWELIK